MSKKSQRTIIPSKLSKSCLALNPNLAEDLKGGLLRISAPCSQVSPVSGPNGQPEAPKVKAGPQMTQTEREFKAMLERENPSATVLFSRFTFLLSTDCRYTPDLAVVWYKNHPPGMCRMEFFEVKGAHLFRGATKSMTTATLVKPKLAAELFPWHRWFRATKAKDGTWSREEYRAAQ